MQPGLLGAGGGGVGAAATREIGSSLHLARSLPPPDLSKGSGCQALAAAEDSCSPWATGLGIRRLLLAFCP